MLGPKLPPGDIDCDAAFTCPGFQILKKATVARLGPRFDGALFDGFAGIGDHEVQIEINGIAKTLAARACAIRIVEGKKPRLRLLIQGTVVFAFESLVESQALGPVSGALIDKLENGFALPLAVADFDGVHEARAGLRIDRQAVHEHVDRF